MIAKAALISALVVAQAGTERGALLHEIPVEVKGDGPLAKAEVVLALTKDAHRRVHLFGPREAGVAREDGALVFRAQAYPAGKDAPSDEHRASSFLVDHATPEVRALATQVRTAGKKPPTLEALRSLVRGHIEKKTLSRGYDPASVTAARKEGDCTEHAVLLAAVARGHGLPSRVVHGVVLVRGQSRIGAFGHAWTEVHADGRWQRVDAALTDSLETLYVPLSVLDDEGPGYTLSMFNWVSPSDVEQVRVTFPSR